nr:MAG TPA: hypothetical protein [Bacteriophage sp.]DAW61089.1 MAG TPA: hypothetical protein [Caudoviricetes sp.]
MVFDRILVYLQYPYEDVRHRNYVLVFVRHISKPLS